MKSKNIMISVLILLIISISLGYAILQSNLNIAGTSVITNPSWNIHWSNVEVTNGSVSGSNVVQAATIDSFLTTVSYNVKLSNPGDYYEFTVDAVNSGALDGMIDTISSKINGVEITTLPYYLSYSVSYNDGAEILENQLLAAGKSEKYKVRIEFKKDITASQLPTSEIDLSLSFSVVYRQATSSAIEVNHITAFSEDSWETIIANVQGGSSNIYNVGDTKAIDMGSLGTHTVRVANNSWPAECNQSNISETACGFVIEFTDIISMHYMNATSTNYGGWPATSMRTYVNSDIYNALPTALKNGIIDTTVISSRNEYNPIFGRDNYTSTDKLYLLATHEVWEDTDGKTNEGINYYDSSYNFTRQLDYYKNNNVTTSSYSKASKKRGNYTNSWGLRSAFSTNLPVFYKVEADGGLDTFSQASNDIGVSPAFRLYRMVTS